MKVDFDTILYIVITVAILIISALGSRRKKRAQQMEAQSYSSSEEENYESDEYNAGNEEYVEPAEAQSPSDIFKNLASRYTGEPGMSSNPLGRLEQILTGKEPQIESMEGESMETTIDEEEQILEEIKRRGEEKEAEVPYQEPVEPVIEATKRVRKGLPGLFENANEIKKAIIYSEILKPKF